MKSITPKASDSKRRIEEARLEGGVPGSLFFSLERRSQEKFPGATRAHARKLIKHENEAGNPTCLRVLSTPSLFRTPGPLVKTKTGIPPASSQLAEGQCFPTRTRRMASFFCGPRPTNPRRGCDPPAEAAQGLGVGFWPVWGGLGFAGLNSTSNPIQPTNSAH